MKKIDRRGFLRLLGIGAGAAVASKIAPVLPAVADEQETMHVKFDRSEDVYRYVNGVSVPRGDYGGDEAAAFVYLSDELAEDSTPVDLGKLIEIKFDWEY